VSDSRDYQWLLARERGEAIGDVALETHARYRNLERLIRELPDMPPPAGWQEHVRAVLGAPVVTVARGSLTSMSAGMSSRGLAVNVPAEPPRRAPAVAARRKRASWAAAGVFAAAAMVAVFITDGQHRDHGFIAQGIFETQVRAGAGLHRSAGPAVGDVLVIRTKDARVVELRAYFGTGPAIARRSRAAGNHGDDALTIELPLTMKGALRVVAYLGGTPPQPEASLDDDLAAAARAGVEVVTAAPIDVL
jgi:hypothetical protein